MEDFDRKLIVNEMAKALAIYFRNHANKDNLTQEDIDGVIEYRSIDGKEVYSLDINKERVTNLLETVDYMNREEERMKKNS